MAACEITAFTPVHVGTGETYSSHDFVYAKGKQRRTSFVVRIDMKKLFHALDSDQKERYIHQMRSADDFQLNKFFRDEKIKHLLKDTERYGSVDRAGLQDAAKPEVRECIKTADVPYLPGSSIKGAVRTALLWRYASEHTPEVCNQLGRELENRTGKKFVLKRYTDNLFTYKGENYSALYDVMKFVLISDFMPTKTITPVINNIRTWSLGDRQMNEKHFSIFAECISKGMSFSGTVDISPQYRALPIGERRKVRETMGRFGLPDPEDSDGFFAALQGIVSDFHRWAFEKEKLLLQEVRGGDSISNSINESLKKEPMMRLGFGVGTLYQTLIGLVEDEDPDLAAKTITDLKLRRYPRRLDGFEIDLPYPKTIELTSDSKPMGWVQWNFTE